MNDPDDSDYLRLTLSPPGQQSYRSSSEPSYSASSSQLSGHQDHPHPHPHHQHHGLATPANSSNDGSADRAPRRGRRSAGGGGGPADHRGGPTKPKDDRIAPTYPWSTDRRAVVQPLDYLLANGIMTIRGEVVCKRCDGKETRDVDLQSSFLPLSSYFLSGKDTMHDRAPKVWMVPRLLDCNLCHQSDCVKPLIDEKKRRINWLFLLLTQTLGLCTLDQLKYFCKHTKKHRTGAKDRVLYLTYVGLLKQLNPSGPYD